MKSNLKRFYYLGGEEKLVGVITISISLLLFFVGLSLVADLLALALQATSFFFDFGSNLKMWEFAVSRLAYAIQEANQVMPPGGRLQILIQLVEAEY